MNQTKEKRAPLSRNDNHPIEHFFRHVLKWIERFIATVTLIVLIVSLGFELAKIFTTAGYLTDIGNYLHNVLTIVVGLEFVRMLIDTTPANILEVLTVAITRHVILTHDDPWSNVACVACIAALFAIRRFFIRRDELKEEMVESE